MQDRLSSLEAEVSRLTHELQAATSARDVVASDLASEREGIVEGHLQTHLYPKGLEFTQDYSQGIVTVLPEPGSEREADSLRTYLRVQSLSNLPLLDVLDWLDEGNPLDVS